jgi:hypothetical protein
MAYSAGLQARRTPPAASIEEKWASLYGDLSLPYVIAVSERPFSIGDESWHRTNVLFGQEAVEYSAGRPVRTVYLPDASGAGHVQGREIPDWQRCSLPAT